jgi:hypothetical protein
MTTKAFAEGTKIVIMLMFTRPVNKFACKVLTQSVNSRILMTWKAQKTNNYNDDPVKDSTWKCA